MFAYLRQAAILAGLSLLLSAPAFGQASLLPNAKQQFVGPTGSPYASGKVFMYVPTTFTKKNTWTLPDQSSLNPNPIILDSAGRAVIYGVGSYRQVLQDSFGNQIWDALTAAPPTSSAPATSGAGDFMALGTVIMVAGYVAPTNYVFAFGQAISRSTYPDALTALTINSAASCTSSSTTVSGITDTTEIRVGAPIEASCLPANTTVASITNSTTIVTNNAAVSGGATTIRVFTYGNGDGATTFNVPDLRGRAPIGADLMPGSIAAGRITSTYYGASAATPGVPGGLQSSTLLTANLPPYTPAGSVSAPTITITGGTLGGTTTFTYNNTGSATIPGTPVTIVATASAPILSGTAQGGVSTPFAVIPPALTVNYAIKVLNGVLPTIGVLSLGGMTGDILCGTGATCVNNTISFTGLAALTNGHIFVGNASNVATDVALTGVIAITNTGVTSFASGAFANPTAQVGLTAINGSAATAMRSDAAPALNQSISPTMTGNWTFNPTSGTALAINPAANSTAMGFQIVQSGGTATVGAETRFNLIFVGSNALNNPGNSTEAFFVQMGTGGPTETGSVIAFKGLLQHNVATPASVNKGDHVAGVFECDASVNDGGTNTGAGAAGTCFGGNLVVQLTSGATNLLAATGLEIDAIIRTGASAKLRWGLSLVSQGDLTGAASDAAINIGSTSGVKWLNAMQIGQNNGQFGIATTGCFACTDGSSNTIATFADFSTITISGNIFNFANFQLTGAGVMNVATGGSYSINSVKIAQTATSPLVITNGVIACSTCLTGNQTITLSGDVSGSGTTAITTTLANVNGNVGTFGSATNAVQVTVNAKGLITAISNVAIAVSPSELSLTNTHILVGNVSNVAADVAMSGDATLANTGALTIAANAVIYAKLQQVAASSLVGNATGSLANATGITLGATLTFSGSALQTGAFSGDITTPANSFVTTLATVNSNVGTCGSSTSIPTVTLNGKGLSTACSGNAVIAPAGTLTGTTLASNVVTSSLTTVGTIGTGVWQGTIIGATYGGTGVNNGSSTITLGGNLTHSGAFGTTITVTATTNSTLPAGTHTLAGLDVAQTWGANQNYGGNQLNNVVIGASTPLAGTFTTVNMTAASNLTLSQNGGTIFTVSNTNAGAGAIAELDVTSNAGTFSAKAFSTAGGGVAQFIYTGPGMNFVNFNASASIAFQTGLSALTALSIDVSQQVFLTAPSTDSGATDATVCRRTSNGQLLAGSGTLGICLGTSGRQFKTAFAPMAAGLDDLIKINFQNYRYTDGFGDNGARLQYGATAQDVEAALPDLARHNASGETINYDAGALLFVGLRSIQQLKAANDNFEARLTRLEASK